MQYPLLKQEQYQNVGGINQKSSEYMTGENQVLDLRNYSFERPGAWLSRPGYTGFATLGANLTIYPGSLIEYVKSNGESYIIYDSGPTLYSLEGHSAIYSPLGQTLQIDFEVYEDYLYFANGTQYARYGGSFSVDLNMPYVLIDTSFTSRATFNTSLSSFGGAGVSTGFYLFNLAYVNDRGIVGPGLEDVVQDLLGLVYFNPGTTTVGTTVGAWRIWGFTIPPGYGISSILVYKTPGVGYSAGIGANGSPFLAADPNSFLGEPVDFFLTTIGGVTTYAIDTPDFTAIEPPTTNILNANNFLSLSLSSGLYPKFIEIYNNMMAMANFENVLDDNGNLVSGKSTLYLSDVGEPESVQAENQFPIRTNNGDFIRALYVFQNALLVFKRRSIHEVSGTSPETISIRDVNLEYGCVNNRSIVQFEDKLWFLDEEGIAEYNGANTFVVSYPIEKSLNTCDFEDSWAFHVKKYHQVWFVIRDRISNRYKAFVFDYISNQWTIYDDFYAISAMALKNTNVQPEVMFFGQNQTGVPKFFRFGESLTTDDSFGMTLVFKTRYHKRLGDSTQELWRRFFLNNTVENVSLGVTLNFYPDYGSSIFLSRTMGLTLFQSRIDFGISAKSMSVEAIIRTTQTVQINGYTIESRYLRSV